MVTTRVTYIELQPGSHYQTMRVIKFRSVSDRLLQLCALKMDVFDLE